MIDENLVARNTDWACRQMTEEFFQGNAHNFRGLIHISRDVDDIHHAVKVAENTPAFKNLCDISQSTFFEVIRQVVDVRTMEVQVMLVCHGRR